MRELENFEKAWVLFKSHRVDELEISVDIVCKQKQAYDLPTSNFHRA
jgi:hypothetical protein